ncbi:MAG: cytochrome c biogenesis protein CcdA [Phototrophicaceae bacterium]
MELSLGLALAAGLISFISPCVLPLVPAYITYMGGRATYQVANSQTNAYGGFMLRLNTLIHSIFFVLGFSVVFVGVGLLSTAFIASIGGNNLNATTNIIGRAGGVVIILFGLHFMGTLSTVLNNLRRHEAWFTPLTSVLITVALSGLIFWAFDLPHLPLDGTISSFIQRYWIALVVLIPLLVYLGIGGAYHQSATFWLQHLNALEIALYADTRSDLTMKKQGGFLSSSLMGIIFAAGWTPCIGPIYGAILTLAANGGSVAWAGALLLAYSLGLGIPFIITAGMLDSAKGVLKRLNRSMGTIKFVSGLFLIGVGILVATNQLQRISALGATGELGVISYNLEECFTQAVAGQIPFGQIMSCVSGEDTTSPSVELEESPSPSGLLTIEEVAGESSTVESPSDTPIGIQVGNQVPNFRTFTETGETVELSSYRGQVILLNFWATWCGPCRVEMPALEEAHRTYADQGLVILAVNNRETAQQMADFRAEMGLTFPFAMDIQGRIQEQFGILNYPSTYLIGRDGTILDVHLGALTLEQINELIDDAL